MNPILEPAAMSADPPELWARPAPGAVARWLGAAGHLLATVRRPAVQPVPPEALDAPTGLHRLEGFIRAGDALLQQAVLEGRTAELLLFEFADLVEVREIYGRATSHEVQALVLQKVKAVAGAHGIAARTGKTAFAVLLRGDRELAEAVVGRHFGKPARIEVDTGGHEIVVVPDIHCATASARDFSVAQVYEQAAAHLAGRREREQRRQLYLQRERERHSRPMHAHPARG